MQMQKCKCNSILSLVHSFIASGQPSPRGVTLGIRLGHFRWGEKRVCAASQGRSATARGGVAGIFNRKLSVTRATRCSRTLLTGAVHLLDIFIRFALKIPQKVLRGSKYSPLTLPSFPSLCSLCRFRY